ncbi:hypothetical protein RBU61_10040 [Tissierella sp. MB52-C2]|jgi:hypothetical protein|uniref:hypothetical protein n=1 Tax=Tissierella sp. MB52-C2 TaxID=3070999 RepID=UPI00280B3248|nr:hypothetical protein [Tissierella sp. MB52-C2]WMM23295.1 hypothetical protein RBU61_10040 [Tissierella sp. MB52-C2]
MKILLLPFIILFVLIFALIGGVLKVTGRLLVGLLGLFFTIIGIILSLTVIGIVVGIPVLILGIIMIISIFF